LNFSNALDRFANSVDRKEEFYSNGYSDIFLDLVTKRFEFTYEMSWKAIKRYLDFVGIGCINPRSCFKAAFAQDLISDESIWLDMIEMRNLSSHIYDENEISELLDKIDEYRIAFCELKSKIAGRIE